MSGDDLRKLAESAGLSPIEVLHEAGINSPETLRKVYNGIHVRTTTRSKVERAIKRLAAKAEAQTA
jgi:hypothetical protein